MLTVSVVSRWGPLSSYGLSRSRWAKIFSLVSGDLSSHLQLPFLSLSLPPTAVSTVVLLRVRRQQPMRNLIDVAEKYLLTLKKDKIPIGPNDV